MVPTRLITALIDLVVPGECAACGIPGEPICAACIDALPVLRGARCRRCGYPWPVMADACRECPAAVGWARQALGYRDQVPAIVSAFKDHRRRDLAGPLAGVMARVITPPPGGAVLVPVPLTPGRLADRGFNQAGLLATALARTWGMPVAQVLVRRDGGASQRGSSRAERLRRPPGAFRVAGHAPLYAVLVDDVITTGATLTAAGRALRDAGSARIGAVALARVASGTTATRVG